VLGQTRRGAALGVRLPVVGGTQPTGILETRLWVGSDVQEVPQGGS